MANQGTIPLSNSLIRKGFGPAIPYNVFNFEVSEGLNSDIILFDTVNDIYDSPVRIENTSGYLELIEGSICVTVPNNQSAGSCEFGFKIEANYSPVNSLIGPKDWDNGYVSPVSGETKCATFFSNFHIPTFYSEDFPNYLIRKLKFRNNTKTSCAGPGGGIYNNYLWHRVLAA